METRANYVLIGLFTLAVIAGAFGFVYWFSSPGSLGERAKYEVVFDGTVSGLRPGASVLFNGLRVGEVATLQIDRDAPRQVVATIAVDKSVVVRADTWVGLEFQGLTGIASVSLRGGSATAPRLDGNPPVLRADLGAGQDVTQAARDVLRKLDAFVTANESSVRTSLKNIELFTHTLADNSERIDRILSGAEKLVGTAETKLDDFAGAAKAVQTVADNLDKYTAEISVGLTRFSQFGLREWERLATDGRRAISVLEQTVKNIDQNPSRLLFGGAPARPVAPRAPLSNAQR
jgi:phospholipid/cholesterol/gamma-HCH transport system substrate-binding protein